MKLSHHLFFAAALFCIAQANGENDAQCAALDDDSTLKIFHISSPCSPFKQTKSLSWEESVLQTESKDQARFQYLAGLAVAKKSTVPIASGRQIIQSPTYIVKAKIGTPPQTMLMAMDTSSDVAWIPCSGCVGCASTTLFSSSNSTTFKNLGCDSLQCKQVPNPTCGGESACAFNLTYGGSSIAANVSQDSFTLATDTVQNYTFGCIQKATGSSLPAQGLLGLGRGALSLMSQTQSLYQSTFSYCLPSYKSPNFSGSLRLGPIGQPPKMKYTPLLKNPRRSSLYYVNLVAIKVGKRTLDIPLTLLAFNPTTGAGTIFDSGTVFTRLVEPVYVAVRDEFRRRIGKDVAWTSLGGFDTCYTVQIPSPPTMTFMFVGMNVTFPPENILIHSTVGTTTCLAMASTPLNVNSVLNVIASMQQQNYRVLFDVPNSRLGLAPQLCT